MLKQLYLVLAIVGAAAPYIFFGRFFAQEGIDLVKFIQALFSTGPAAGFTVDLVISSLVFWIFSYGEAKKRHMQNWWLYVVANLTIGLSFALPLFFYFRQIKLEQE